MDRFRDSPPPKPWPRKPPAGTTCAASVPCPTPEACEDEWRRMVDPGGTIHLHRCTEVATETLWWGMETWLCSKHADIFEEKGRAIRNPRAKRPVNDGFRTLEVIMNSVYDDEGWTIEDFLDRMGYGEGVLDMLEWGGPGCFPPEVREDAQTIDDCLGRMESFFDSRG